MGSRLVLDGGLATELEQRGYDLSIGKLWSARLLRTNPLAIRDIHLRYLDAGADIITSATYQATVEGYMAEFQMERNEAECELIAGAKLAVDVRDEFCKSTKRHAKVAGSIGPYGGSLGDGSEYRGNYGVSRGMYSLYESLKSELTVLFLTPSDIGNLTLIRNIT